MKANHLRKLIWLLVMIGSGLGIGLQVNRLGFNPWWLGFGFGIGLALSSFGLTWLLKHWNYPEERFYFLYDSFACLPLLLLIPLAFWPSNPSHPLAIPVSVVNKIRFPGMQHFLPLALPDYFRLMAAGAGWILTGFLRLGLWGRACLTVWPRIQSFSNRMVFLTALLAGLWLHGWSAIIYPPAGDEVHYLLMAKSFLTQGNFDLKDIFNQGTWKEDYPAETLDFHGHPDNQGRWLSRHMPALSIILAPGYGLLGRWGAVVCNLFLLALALSALYGLAQDLGASPRQAAGSFALALLSPPASTYGYLLYPVVIGMLLVVWGSRLLMRVQDKKAALGLGAVIGLLPWFHQGFAVLSLVLGVLAVWQLWQSRNASAFLWLLGSGLVIGIPWFLIFTRFYQTAFTQGDYTFAFRPLFFLSAILGLAFDRYYGAWLTAPILLLSVAAFRWLWPQQKNQIYLWVGWLGMSILMAGLFVDWTGFSASFPRLIAPACFPLYAVLGFYFPPTQKISRTFWVLSGWGVLLSLASWICPPLLYELPRMKIFAFLSSHHFPMIWEIFPALSHQPGRNEIVKGIIWMSVAALAIWQWQRRYGPRSLSAVPRQAEPGQ